MRGFPGIRFDSVRSMVVVLMNNYLTLINSVDDDITQSSFLGSLFNNTWRDKYTNQSAAT